MVKRRIELESGSSVLILCTDENDWCEVGLQHNEHFHKLGAGDKNTIIERIKDALVNNHLENIGEINNVQVAWVLSLSEIHSSIYVGIKGDVWRFFFQNEAGNTFAEVTVTQEICKIWLSLLSVPVKPNGNKEEPGKEGE